MGVHMYWGICKRQKRNWKWKLETELETGNGLKNSWLASRTCRHQKARVTACLPVYSVGFWYQTSCTRGLYCRIRSDLSFTICPGASPWLCIEHVRGSLTAGGHLLWEVTLIHIIKVVSWRRWIIWYSPTSSTTPTLPNLQHACQRTGMPLRWRPWFLLQSWKD